MLGPGGMLSGAGEAGGAGGAGSPDTRRPDSCCQMGNHAETDIVLNPERAPDESTDLMRYWVHSHGVTF